jgi:hypothetical protein
MCPWSKTEQSGAGHHEIGYTSPSILKKQKIFIDAQEVASPGSLDWNPIDRWLRNMMKLHDSLAAGENMAFLLLPGEEAYNSTTSASAVWNTPTSSIHCGPAPPLDVGPTAIDTGRD